MDRHRHFNDIRLEFEIRHVTRSKHVVLFLFLKELYRYISLRMRQARQSDALLHLACLEYCKLCLARFSGVSFDYLYPALSAESLASAGVIYKQTCV